MNQLPALLLVLLWLPGGLLSAPASYRVLVETFPDAPVVGHPTHISLRLTEALDPPDPLLGDEVPATCQVVAQLESSEGEILFGPELVAPQELQGEIFALSHTFEDAGHYQLVWSFHDPGQGTSWHEVPLIIEADPIGG